MEVTDLGRDEQSLLLYFETQAVDHRGRVDTRYMNKADHDIAKRWNTGRFVEFGRIKFDDIREHRTHWCYLSDEAWKIAAELRRQKALRTWSKRAWHKAGEE